MKTELEHEVILDLILYVRFARNLLGNQNAEYWQKEMKQIEELIEKVQNEVETQDKLRYEKLSKELGLS